MATRTTRRAQEKMDLQHVLTVVLDLDDDAPLVQAVEQLYISRVQDLICYPEDDITKLSYFNSTTNKETFVPAHQKQHIRMLKAFQHFNVDNNTPIHDWMSVTMENYEDFRASPAATQYTSGPNVAPAYRKITTTKPSSNYNNSSDPVSSFKKGIKRDPSNFPDLVQDKQWDNFHRSMTAEAYAQDVADILDPAYIPDPNDTSAQELFQLKQRYMYSVFVRNLKNDLGKGIVRQYEATFDAQAAYSKLLTYYKDSTKSSLDASNILTYITTARLGSAGSWKGSTSNFIIHWTDQIRQYHTLVPSSDRFSDQQLLTMLQNAVHPIAELRQVKNQADQMKAQFGSAITYSQYVKLLESSCIQYDSQFSDSRNMANTKRAIYSHEFDTENNDDEPYDDAYGIDVDSYTILANATMRPPPNRNPPRHRDIRRDNSRSNYMTAGTRMGKDKWTKLTPEMRLLWDKLDDESKRIILGTDKRTINIHDLSAGELLALQAHKHELNAPDSDDTPADNATVPHEDIQEQVDDTELLVNAAKSNSVHPGDIRRVLGDSQGRPVQFTTKTHAITYTVSASKTKQSKQSLVDRGANGGVAGEDVRLVPNGFTHRYADIEGIDNHRITHKQIGTFGGVTETQYGPVILIFNEYAYNGQGPTIHAPTQFEHYGIDVNDKSVKVGGLQRITTPDGYCLPLDIVHGLPRLKIRPYTDDEWDSLPMVIMTSDQVWDPTQLDHTYNDVEEWYDAVTKLENNELYNLFDEYGNYRHRTEVQMHDYTTASSDTHHDNPDDIVHQCILTTRQHTVSTSKRDYEKLRPLFGWLPTSTIEKTFALSTQYGKLPNSTILKKHYKSPNPALNVKRRNESIATDTVFSDTVAIDNGSTVAQFFVGTETMVCDVYSMKTSKQFVNTLEDIIIARGAPTRLLSDSATLEISARVKDILRTMFIGNWQSEPYQQHQNPAERRYQTVKSLANVILDRTSAPAHVWFLCLEYVCFLLNHTYCQSINAIPMQCLTGSTPDISPLLRFYFWQPVLCLVNDSHFPSESREERGHFVGIAENVGHSMTFKILSDKSQKIICRSNIRPVTDSDPNFRSLLLHGEEFNDSATTKISNPVIKSKGDTIQKMKQEQTKMGSQDSIGMGSQDNKEKNKNSIPVFSPSDLVGRTFLMDEQEDGQRLRARIIEAIEDHETSVEQNPTKIRFRCSLEGGNLDAMEELIAYNEVVDYITRDDETDIVWKFKRIVAHEGPLSKNDHSYKGSKYNVMIEWENGEKTSEPLSILAKDDPVTCAIYARENDLLDLDGWKQFRKIAMRKQTFDRQVNQAKLRSYRRTPKYMFGYQVPHDYKEAINLDKLNGNKRWEEATASEMSVMNEYDVFKDHGHRNRTKPPDGHKKIRVHLVFAVKHDGRHKARLVADGHLTDAPTESVYSGVVSLRGLRLVVFLGELNNLEAWAGDIGSAYLEAKTREKLYIIAGPEFKELEDHILLIYKALYGLRTSGARWHDRFADCMREMGFFASKAEPDIWMRAQEDKYYEYIAVYVDDLAIAAKDPASIIKELRTKHKFKIKGDGPITYHLGMDFERDEHGIMCIKPTKYVEKMIESFTRTFGKAPEQNVTSPLAKNDHPELDTSELLEGDDIVRYQSCIGALQWLISIGRFDIAVAVMTLSSFRAAPRQGHLDRIKRIYGYIAKMRYACIRVRTAEPDYSALPVQEHDWARSVYGDVCEILPKDAPKPLGKRVTSTHYVDANLMHCMLTGKSVTAVLHILNQMPIDWHTKKQATVETATYGSEFVAARTCVEQIIELRTQLRYLGVPIREACYMFGDNKSVVDSATIPHAKLHKRHTMLSFHRVREAIASKYIRFYHIEGENNPADILSKHWGYAQIWPMLKPILFYQGNTEELIT
ncbi:MAG: reverse transcriptase domain-containing protein [Bacteroidota bacterium]